MRITDLESSHSSLKSALVEGRDSPLYHMTSITNLASILTNGLKPRTKHVIDSKDVMGISTTRSFDLAMGLVSECVIVLNQRAISQRHKIVPIQYWRLPNARHSAKLGKPTGTLTTQQTEYEEFIITKTVIDPKYFDKIIIMKNKISPMEKGLLQEILDEFSDRFIFEII